MNSPRKIFEHQEQDARDGTSRAPRTLKKIVDRRQFPILYIFVSLFLFGVFLTVPYFVIQPSNSRYKLDIWTSESATFSNFASEVAGTARLLPGRQETILAPSAGLVKINVRRGQSIKTGDLLLSVTNPNLISELENQQDDKAKLIRATQTVEFDIKSARDDMLRFETSTKRKEENILANVRTVQNLYDIGAASKLELETARQDLDELRIQSHDSRKEKNATLRKLDSDLMETKIGLARITKNISKTRSTLLNQKVFAPFSGVIDSFSVGDGEKVDQGKPLVRILAPNVKLALITVDATDAPAIRVGQKVRIQINTRELRGVVESVDQIIEDSSDRNNSLRLVAKLAKPEDTIRPGTTGVATVELPSRRHVLTVTNGPHVASGGGQFFYVVDRTRFTAKRTSVMLGEITQSSVEIVSGVQEGDLILTTPYDDFRNHEEIELMPTGEL